MTRRDANTAMATALVDEWARAGVRCAVLSPGSRSAPLALALAADSRIELHVLLDERSAGFFAVGAAKASGRPSIVLCTSGTAAANLHPAVLEAHHAVVPLIVCTADRPPELRDTGAGQAVDQLKMFGPAARWFAEVGAPEDVPGAGRYWRSVASRAVSEACGPPAGPVQLNLAFREPLIPTGAELVPAPGRADGAPWVRSSPVSAVPQPGDVDRVAETVLSGVRGLVVAGWGAAADAGAVQGFAEAAGWPVLADPVSGLRQGRLAVSTYDAVLRAPQVAERLCPEWVLHLGAPLTSKVATEWLDESVPRLLVDPHGAWLDPQRGASERIVADPTALLEAVAARLPGTRSSPWLREWIAVEETARRAIDELIGEWPEPFEGRVARDVAHALPDGATLVVGSSMPVRDLEGFARPRSGLRVLANRGVSGIDGFVSTVLGVATVTDGPVAAVMGDLTFLHDGGGLLHAGQSHSDIVLVVLDNDGGGVFSFLPQAGRPEHFETLFGTPHERDLVGLAAAYGLSARRVAKADEVEAALADAVLAGGPQVIVVPTDRAENVTRHRQVWDAVAAAVAASALGEVSPS